MHTIEYRELAIKDLEAIFENMFRDYPTQTFDYIDKLQKSIELLTTNPYLGVTCQSKNINHDCRVLIFQNYLIVYGVTESSVMIARILNTRQDYQNSDLGI